MRFATSTSDVWCGLYHNYNNDGQPLGFLRLAQPLLRAHRRRTGPLALQVQGGLRVGQVDLPGVRAEVVVLLVVAELQALRAGGRVEGVQGPALQLLHVQALPDLLAQVLLPGRLTQDMMYIMCIMCIDLYENY